MFRAHKYKNDLVQLERERRRTVERALVELFPHLVQLNEAVGAREGELGRFIEGISQRNAASRKRTGTAEERATIKTMRADLKELRAQRKAARQEAFASKLWETRREEINAGAVTEQKRLRSECEVYWGTYLIVEKSMQYSRSGAPPKFHRWDGNATIAVQLQHGLSPAEALAGQDNRLRIQMLDNCRAVAWLRIGSTENREPVWTTVPFTMHRPLPKTSRIKWASLVLRRVGTNKEWAVQFDLNGLDAPVQDTALTHTVGIDVGWRLKPEGLRVAYWIGSDNREGELVIPLGRLERWAYCEKLQSVRDLHFNVVREFLAAWAAEQELPDWFVERTETLTQWRSARRLASLVWHWKFNRFPLDANIHPAATQLRRSLHLHEKHYGYPESAFDLMEAWRKKDKHLYDWLAWQRKNNERWRDHFYRNFVTEINKGYCAVKVEDCNWAQMMKTVPPEKLETAAGARKYQRVASVGRLIMLLKEGAALVQKVPAEQTTMRCHLCGELTGEIDRHKLTHTCTSCGGEFDQDRNGAVNILASAPVEEQSPPGLAP